MSRRFLPLIGLLVQLSAACGGVQPTSQEAPPADVAGAPATIAEAARKEERAPDVGDADRLRAPRELGYASDAVPTSGPAAAPRAEAPIIGLMGGGFGTRGEGKGSGGLGLRGTGLGGGGGSYAGSAELGSGSPRLQQTPALRAGSTDDNADLPAFLSYLQGWDRRGGNQPHYRAMDVSGRALVQVVDADGRPVPGASVRLMDGREVAWSASTYGDGRAPIYPSLARSGQRWELVVEGAGDRQSRTWDGHDTTVRLGRSVASARVVPIDVVIILDTTGSMGDEIARLQQSLLGVTRRLASRGQEIDLRVGAVLYRDVGDEYVTRRYPLTAGLEDFNGQLSAASAGGGGDGPESLNQGLAEAVHAQPWRPDAAHVAFLIADAAPHMDYPRDIPYTVGAQDAVGRGIRVHTVAASGLDESGTVVFRQIAQLTRGRFVFIEYDGSTARTAASHGVANPEQVASNNLDAILYERVAAEIDGWRQI